MLIHHTRYYLESIEAYRRARRKGHLPRCLYRLQNVRTRFKPHRTVNTINRPPSPTSHPTSPGVPTSAITPPNDGQRYTSAPRERKKEPSERCHLYILESRLGYERPAHKPTTRTAHLVQEQLHLHLAFDQDGNAWEHGAVVLHVTGDRKTSSDNTGKENGQKAGRHYVQR